MLGSVLSAVYTAETLSEALKLRRQLKAGESVVTRDGIWLGNDWLRVSRDADPHAGVIEREEIAARYPRRRSVRSKTKSRRLERRLETHPRAGPRARRPPRALADGSESAAPRSCRPPRRTDSAQARTDDAARRLEQLESSLPTCASSFRAVKPSCGPRAPGWKPPSTHSPRSSRSAWISSRTASGCAPTWRGARTAAAAAQQHARDLAVQVESRRSSHTALITTVGRLEKQLEDLHARRLRAARANCRGRGTARRGTVAAGTRIAAARGSRGGIAGRANRQRRVGCAAARARCGALRSGAAPGSGALQPR